MDRHLAEVRLVTDGQTIFRVAQYEEELLDALRQGQLAFFVAINEIAMEVEEDITRFELDRERFLDMLRRVEDDVILEANSKPAELSVGRSQASISLLADRLRRIRLLTSCCADCASKPA